VDEFYVFLDDGSQLPQRLVRWRRTKVFESICYWDAVKNVWVSNGDLMKYFLGEPGLERVSRDQAQNWFGAAAVDPST
jgi:hypothetical protein